MPGGPPLQSLCDQQAELLGGGATGGEAPQVDRQLAGDGDHDLLPASRALADKGLPPFGYGTITRLMLKQAPSGLDEEMADAGIAVTGDTALEAGASRGMLTRAEPSIAGYLAAIAEPVPVADLAVEELPGESADVSGQGGWCGGLQLPG